MSTENTVWLVGGLIIIVISLVVALFDRHPTSIDDACSAIFIACCWPILLPMVLLFGLAVLIGSAPAYLINKLKGVRS